MRILLVNEGITLIGLQNNIGVMQLGKVTCCGFRVGGSGLMAGYQVCLPIPCPGSLLS